MRPMSHSGALRALPVLCGLACLVPATAGAASTGAASAAPSATSSSSTSVSAKLDRGLVRWGQSVRVTGRVTGGSARQFVALQYQARGAASWKTLTKTRTKAHRYAFSRALPGRGNVRVALGEGLVQAVRADAAANGPATSPYSAVHGVRVRSAIGLRTLATSVASGDRAVVTGHVLPHRAGRLVVVQRKTGHGWSTAVRTHTRHDGSYKLAWRPGSSGAIRVVTGGDRVAAGTVRSAGRVSLIRFRGALASRYDDYGGPLACSNGTLGYDQIGVANKSLPCGTKVTIRYHGRTVVAPVIDRGPYVGNREFDLTGAAARALGFNGVGTIQVAY